MFTQRIKDFFGLLANYSYDMMRYWKFAFNNRDFSHSTDSHILSRIWMNAHSIEKGLSLLSPRPGFGKQVVKELVILLNEAQHRNLDRNEMAIHSALGALQGYIQFNQKHTYDLGSVRNEIEGVLSFYGGLTKEPTEYLHKDDIQTQGKGDFKALASSRHSIRQFASDPIDLTLLLDAIRLAQNSPSVCNRQCARVYIYTDKAKIARLAQLQKGSREFGKTASCFLIVTGDLTSFVTSAERNEVFIDCGMFSMSLIYALHYYGLGTCPLNWCKNIFEDKELRKEFEISPSETVIMMVAIGHMLDEFNVARSSREQLEKIVKIC